jgi:hypothetical protein
VIETFLDEDAVLPVGGQQNIARGDLVGERDLDHRAALINFQFRYGSAQGAWEIGERF